jgi:hypothetical protein
MTGTRIAADTHVPSTWLGGGTCVEGDIRVAFELLDGDDETEDDT